VWATHVGGISEVKPTKPLYGPANSKTLRDPEPRWTPSVKNLSRPPVKDASGPRGAAAARVVGDSLTKGRVSMDFRGNGDGG